MCVFFFFKQKTAYEMRISDWSSDVCSSDLRCAKLAIEPGPYIGPVGGVAPTYAPDAPRKVGNRCGCRSGLRPRRSALLQATARNVVRQVPQPPRPEQHRERTGLGFSPEHRKASCRARVGT